MLVILAIISMLVFIVPSVWKFRFTLSVIVLVAIVSCVEAFSSFFAVSQVNYYDSSANLLFNADLPVVDSLSAVFIIITSIAAVSVTLYSKDYLRDYEAKRSPVHMSLHYAALALMYISMIFVVTFRGAFAFLFSWELMTITSFLLIIFEGEKREVRRAAVNYLILMHIGFVFILSGFVIASEGGSEWGFDTLSVYFMNNSPVLLFILFFIGFGMKAGVFPLHVWLPEAHPAAPSHVSALMSGIMIKMGVYGVLRVLTYVVTDFFTIGLIILVTGIVTALWGIIFASLQNDLKKLLAYSSIENVGIIFMGIGIGVIGISSNNTTLAVLAISGALLHVINHSFFKSLLFLGAGSIYKATHTRNIDELGGLSKSMPITTIFFLIGSFAICALPPFNGFVSEFLIYLGLITSVGSGSDVLISIITVASLAVVGGLAVLVFSKAFGISFLGTARCCKSESAKEVGVWMLGAQLLPLSAILLIGFFPVFIVETVTNIVSVTYSIPVAPSLHARLFNSTVYISVVVFILIALVVLIYRYKVKLLKNRTVTKSPTWGCAFTAPNSKMQYTGESFSEGIQSLTGSFASSSNESAEVSKDEIFAKPHDFGVKRHDKIDQLVSTRWLFIIRKINARLALFQTGNINHYILHALLFLALILLLTMMNII